MFPDHLRTVETEDKCFKCTYFDVGSFEDIFINSRCQSTCKRHHFGFLRFQSSQTICDDFIIRPDFAHQESPDEVSFEDLHIKLEQKAIKDVRETAQEAQIRYLTRIANAVKALPFGSSIALPWCRESFSELDEAMKIWEDSLK